MSLRRPPFSAALSDPLRYERQLEWLHAQYSEPWRAKRLSHGGVSLDQLVADKRRAARLVARAVREGTYRASPAQLISVFVKDRFRELVRMPALDFVLHGVVGDALAELMEPRLSPHLYSYRRRHSSWHAIRTFAAWVRQHGRSERDPQRRGLFVLRADVRRYADSVPVGKQSLLWTQLLELTGLSEDDPLWSLLLDVVRPVILDEEGIAGQRSVGLALGSPTATILLNLYLVPLDHALDGFHGGFYARYGDDILFAHPSAEVLRAALATLDEILAARDLSLNASKQRLLFFNGAGRVDPAWPEARGSRAVPFLGGQVNFDGTVALPPPKTRELLSELRQRLVHSRRLLAGRLLAERAPILCEIANHALDAASPVAQRHANMLRMLVTDRKQLVDLDRRVAQLVAWALTGEPSARAFRQASHRFLRDQGLRSLVVARNAD